jgi:hypothetical protein
MCLTRNGNLFIFVPSGLDRESKPLFWEFVNNLPDKSVYWRQWSFVIEGFGFVIVSAIDMKNEEIIWPDVEAMVASFRMVKPN